MKIPKIPLIKLPITDKSKSNKIINKLSYMGYGCSEAREALAILETHNIDKSQFNFPYGSFEVYKQHVLTGDLEPDIESRIMTDARREEIRINVEEKKIWHTRSNYLEPKH